MKLVHETSSTKNRGAKITTFACTAVTLFSLQLQLFHCSKSELPFCLSENLQKIKTCFSETGVREIKLLRHMTQANLV